MNQERLMKVLRSPHVSEKAANVADKANQYVFKVSPDATKKEIGEAVSLLFKVEVDKVRTVNIQGKAKRTGARLGRRAGVRKAYVSLKPGFEIDLLGTQ